MNESQKRMIREMAEQGISDAEISEKLFYSETYVRRMRAAAGIRRKCGSPLPASEIAQIVEMRKSGMSKRAISKKLGRSHNTVDKYLQQEGVE